MKKYNVELANDRIARELPSNAPAKRPLKCLKFNAHDKTDGVNLAAAMRERDLSNGKGGQPC